MNTWIEGPSPRERRGMGCVGKGCLILSCFIVFLIIAGAIGLYFGTQTYSALLHGLSWANKTHVLAQEPSPVPQFETTDENVAAAERKWKDFENGRARGKAFVAIEGNRLRIQTSVPLGEFVGHGRYYLNGDIVVESNGPESLQNPRLSSITINNEPVPPDVLDWKYHARPLRDYLHEYRTTYGSGSFEIRDGKLIIDRRGGD